MKNSNYIVTKYIVVMYSAMIIFLIGFGVSETRNRERLRVSETRFNALKTVSENIIKEQYMHIERLQNWHRILLNNNNYDINNEIRKNKQERLTNKKF